jgi:GxxExxY protein
MRQSQLPREVELLSHEIIGAAIEVHRELGPGLLEKIYEEALAHELSLREIVVQRQHEIPVVYKGKEIRGQRVDMLVGGLVVVETKARALLPEIDAAQLLSYIRAAGLPLGLLINFNVPLLKEGLKRVFNERVVGLPLPPSGSSGTSR